MAGGSSNPSVLYSSGYRNDLIDVSFASGDKEYNLFVHLHWMCIKHCTQGYSLRL